MRGIKLVRLALVAFVLLALSGAVVGCSSAAPPAPGPIDSAQLRTLQTAGARIVDVRTVEEFAMGHIEGAENVPMDTLQATSAGWDTSKDVVVYCATGSRSAAAADYLNQSGFTKVYDLAGGVVKWDGQLVK